MLGLNDKLKKLSLEGKDIRVAIVGIGQMGGSLAAQIKALTGIRAVAIFNRNINNAARRLMDIGYKRSEIFLLESSIKADDDIPATNVYSVSKGTRSIEDVVSDALLKGQVVVGDNIDLISKISQIELVVDATGSPEAGAIIAIKTLNSKKHLVTLNVETDVTVGPLLKGIAARNGVVYTVSAGDEPAALKELYDFADATGLDVVAAGKGKNNPLDREANPQTLAEYSAKKGSSARMMTSFVDGSKSMFEMACVSNATGLVPDVRGMHGPRVNVKELKEVFSLKKDGGILDKKGVVDFAIGDVAPGVFLVYTSSLKVIREELKYLLFGDGPNYLLYRPYHLTSIETPLSIARAYFYGEPTIVPDKGLVSEVITYAKKDLVSGQAIDSIGGFCIYGMIELHDIAKRENLLPISLSEGAILKRDIKKNKPITFDDVDIPDDSLIYDLRKKQDSINQ